MNVAVPFADLLALEPAGPQAFESRVLPQPEVPRLFGGQLLAQALWAAGRAPAALAHVASARGSFLRPADPEQVVTYRVGVVKEGRLLAHRRVVVTQREREVFVLDATFDRDVPADGPTPVPVPVGAGPAQAHVDPALGGSPLAGFPATDCFELRFVHPPAERGRQPFHPFWVRGTGLGAELPADPLGQACALAFVSDMGSLSGALPRAEQLDPFTGSSLEHAISFGTGVDLSAWHLVDLQPMLRAGRRGVASGDIADQHGRRIAVVTQLAYF